LYFINNEETNEIEFKKKVLIENVKRMKNTKNTLSQNILMTVIIIIIINLLFVRTLINNCV